MFILLLLAIIITGPELPPHLAQVRPILSGREDTEPSERKPRVALPPWPLVLHTHEQSPALLLSLQELEAGDRDGDLEVVQGEHAAVSWQQRSQAALQLQELGGGGVGGIPVPDFLLPSQDVHVEVPSVEVDPGLN